jgi:hypothetical protein
VHGEPTGIFPRFTRDPEAERTGDNQMTIDITRRRFLKTTGGALALSLLQLDWMTGSERVAQASALPDWPTEYRGFEDVYRNKWT